MTCRTVVLAMAVGLAASVATAQDVQVDWDRSASFALYETYSWSTDSSLTRTTLLDRRIIQAVETQLHSKGLRARDRGDLSVAVHLATKDRAALNGFYANWRGSDWGGVGTTGIVGELTRGTLIVDVFDGYTGSLLWRGSATGSVSNNPEQSHKRIEKAVEKMFRNFPPAVATQ